MGNAEIIANLAGRWPEWELQGIGPGQESIVRAAAVGMVFNVWRNGPLEDMHGGGGKRGLGPSDGEIFAESVSLHRHAVHVLRSGERHMMLEFEQIVLDRNRPWAAGGRTLQVMGYGYLGEFAKHVRSRINALLSLHRIYGQKVMLGYLIAQAGPVREFHFGMPRWWQIVDNVDWMMRHSAHPRWRDYVEAAPEQTPSVDELCTALRAAPDRLALPVLEWLTSNCILMVASNPRFGERFKR
jgi:hypothetical protein